MQMQRQMQMHVLVIGCHGMVHGSCVCFALFFFLFLVAPPFYVYA